MLQMYYVVISLHHIFVSAVEKISRGSRSWLLILWETESSMPSSLKGELSLLLVLFFAGVCIICLSHNHHKAEPACHASQLRLFCCRLEKLQSFLPILCWKKKNQLGFWTPQVLSVYLAVVLLFYRCGSWKPDVGRCIIKIPKSQMCRRLNFSRGF